MNNPIQLTNPNRSLGNARQRAPWRRGLLLSALALVVAWLALSPQARAVCQQGCDGSDSTFLGDDALIINIGNFNTAVGFQALSNNYIGSNNTATGAYALYSNVGNGAGTEGRDNTASGSYTLYSNITGFDNTGNGVNALFYNTNGAYNTANGALALSHNTTANYNTATGYLALNSNTTGFQNTANGALALKSNITGNRNVAEGVNALYTNGAGNFNTAVGFQSLYANSGSNNLALGFNAGSSLTTGSGNVCIGYNVVGVAGESNTTRISNIYYSVASGRPVYIDSDNKIGTLVSSRRFKDEIKPMDKASEAILALKPVTFHYKKEIEPNGSIMFGLVAEDVEKVDPDLVTRNDKGEPETVRYEAVNAMLLNEFLKEHRKVQRLEATIAAQQKGLEAQQKQSQTTAAQQQKEIAALTAALKAQAAQIQKVSNQLAMSQSAARVVRTN